MNTTVTGNSQYIPASFYDNNGKLLVSDEKAAKVSEGLQTLAGKMPPAQREVFLDMLQSSALAPSPNLNEADFKAAIDRLSLASELVSLVVTGDLASMLARLLIEQAASQRKDALDSRLNAREDAKTNLESQASELRSSAQDLINGAIGALVMTVVLSAVAMIGSAIAAVKSGGVLDKMKSATSMMDDLTDSVKSADISKFQQLQAKMTELGQAGTKINSAAQVAQASGTIGQAGGSAFTSFYGAESKKTEADASLFAAEAQYQEGQADIAKDIHSALDEMIKSIINFLKEMQENEAQMMQAFTKV